MKKIYIAIIIILAVGAAFYVYRNKNVAPVSMDSVKVFNGKNSSFVINNETVQLTNGSHEVEAAPGSASKIETKYFGNEGKGDYNGDGQEDISFLVYQRTGGSGVFYYAVVALKTDDGYKTTNAFFIGDRIAPQTTEIRSGEYM